MKTELLSDWKQVKLIDVSLDKGQYGSGASAIEYNSKKPRYVRITDIDNNGQLKSDDPRSPNQVEEKYFLEYEDFLFARSGSVGRTYLHEKRGGIYQYAGYLIRFKLNRKLILPKYLYYVTKSKFYLEWIEKQQKSVTISNINAQQYASFRFMLPPILIQKKIVSILEKAEKVKELRKEADELTKDFLKAVFFEMFGNPKKNGKWKKSPLNGFGHIMTGNTPPRKNKEYYGNYIDWIKSDNLNTPNTYITKSTEGLSEKGVKAGRVVPKGSVLVTCIAGSISSIGNAAIADKDVAFNQQINAITPNNNVDSFYLYYLIKNSQEIIQNASTKSLKGIVSKSKFSLIELPLPPISLQNQFAEIAEEIEQMMKYQKQSKQEIDNMSNILMQKAFKGELIC